MSQDHDQVLSSGLDPEPTDVAVDEPRRRRWRAVALVLGALLVAGLLTVWLLRKDIADNVIGSQLEAMGLPARYEIVRIGPTEQVIRNLSIGDPQRPDLTVAELRVATRLVWGLPGIGRITVVRPRLYGSWRSGKVSFGSLDKVLFGGKGGPFRMPDLDAKIVDGRALIDSDHGRIGIKVAGEGPLRGGFAGELAAIAPRLALDGCTAERVTLYGRVSTESERPRFVGPVRTRRLNCPARGLLLGSGGVQADVMLDQTLDGAEGRLALALGGVRSGAATIVAATGGMRFTYRRDALTLSYDLALKDLATPQARVAFLSLEGRGRATAALARFDFEGDMRGRGVAIGDAADEALKQVERAGAGTLAQSLAAQLRTSLAREMRDSSIDANVILRRSGEGLSLVVPRGSLRGGSGASLLALSRVQALFAADRGAPRVTGNFATGGQGLPQAWGRMEADESGRLSLRASMPDYHAGTARLAVPRLSMAQGPDGALGFAGQVALSGALPGGQAQNLVLPLEGRWAANGDLALWRRCTDVSFDSLHFASLALERRKLTVCPSAGGSVISSRAGETLVAAGVPSLDVSGKLGQTPIRIASGPIGYAQVGGRPGVLKANALSVALGPVRTASHFAISRIDARVGADVAGTFAQADFGLYAVPLDLKDTAGAWRFANGVLSIANAKFTLVDRQAVARFQPMVAQGATLRLADNRIAAQALLSEPTSGRAVVRADIVHDLGTAAGHANLTVDGIAFDEKLQADQISRLALGVVSSLRGVVSGSGRIDWDARGVTSRGRFASQGLDFAAAFGPVRGLSGEVVFTDLLGLVTAPDQSVRIASVNPGIEVTDGTLSFQLEPDFLLRVNGAKWPFMEGTLTLDPATMRVGVAETRRYTLRVEGLNAASFVQRLELANINASGIFDGEMPLVFDESGGRIENGFLVSRAPGGNVSYIGALTYKDLSAMGNFAFDALKSIDYRRMEIGLGGSLSGEIVTRISFDGLSQGAGAKQNFLTKRIAKLPIRFVVNLKAPFFSLFGSMRSLYDPAYVTDPRVLGLLDAQGHRPGNAPDATMLPPPIQPPVSGNER